MKFGFLIFIIFLLINESIVSGINLFGEESPPPITLPALAEAKPIFLNLK